MSNKDQGLLPGLQPQSLGGRARAQSLSPDARSAIARRAAEARWDRVVDGIRIPRATHEGELHLGNKTIACAVLEDGTRVINQSSFLRAIGRSIRPPAGQGSSSLQRAIDDDVGFEELPPFVPSKNLKPFITKELMDSKNPIVYRPLVGGRMAFGYRAEILPLVCYAYVDAAKAGALLNSQKRMLEAAEIIIRGLATVGVIALVDEATGYQEIRDRQALQRILDLYIAKELAAWAKRFPDDFYKEMFRLRGWEWRGVKVGKPSFVGKLTNDLVYQRLAPGILEMLQNKNPVTVSGYRRSKHHQWLTDDIGHPALAQHLWATIALMRASNDWRSFYRMMDRSLPKKSGQLPLLMDD